MTAAKKTPKKAALKKRPFKRADALVAEPIKFPIPKTMLVNAPRISPALYPRKGLRAFLAFLIRRFNGPLIDTLMDIEKNMRVYHNRGYTGGRQGNYWNCTGMQQRYLAMLMIYHYANGQDWDPIVTWSN